MFTRQDRSRRLTLRATGAVSIAAALALLNGCIVQERVYAPPPDGYTPAPSEYTPPANEYPPSSQDYPQSSQDYPQAAPAYEYAEPRIEVRAAEPPPPLPYYEQPPCPEPGYLWTPGYWGYSTEGYFWVPGTWVMPPQVGVLWTPGYWGWGGGVYVFHAGYWGPHVGFYGGINYGGGYIGEGYEGGRWERDRFSYNTSVNNINTTIIHNTYNQTVINNVTVNRVSYNGGRGGVAAAPSNRDQLAARESHIPPPVMQTRHINEAARTPELQARVNQGRPPIAATPRPAAFTAPNIVRARGATIPPPTAPGALRPAEQGNHSALETAAASSAIRAASAALAAPTAIRAAAAAPAAPTAIRTAAAAPAAPTAIHAAAAAPAAPTAIRTAAATAAAPTTPCATTTAAAAPSSATAARRASADAARRGQARRQSLAGRIYGPKRCRKPNSLLIREFRAAFEEGIHRAPRAFALSDLIVAQAAGA